MRAPTREPGGGPTKVRDPPNSHVRLTRAAAEGGKGEGDSLPSSALPRHAERAQGGNPKHSSTGPPHATGPRTKRGSPSSRSTRKPRAGRRVWGAGHVHPPRTGAPIARYARKGRGGPPYPRGRVSGTPRAAYATSTRHAGRGGGKGGSTPQPDGEGGPPLEQARTFFVHGLIQEMESNPQDLSRFSPPASGSEGEEIRGDSQGGTRVGVGAPTPLGGRGTPEDQARAIVARIINFLPGGGPHSGQTPENQQQDLQTQ